MKTISWLLNRQVLSAVCAAPLLFSSIYALADEMPAVEATPAAAAAPAEPAPDWTFTLNAGLYSEYMFRGVSLSDGPALQFGADLGHSSGFYAGTWWSNIDKNFFGHGDGFSGGDSLETDWYAGYAHTFASGFGINVLGNYYYYPDREDSFSDVTNSGNKQDTFEASIGLTYKWLTYTYYRVLTDNYGASKDYTKDGTDDTDGAEYHELKFNYTLPIGDLNLLAKVGYTDTKNQLGDQGDWAIGLNRNFSLPSAGKPIEGFNAGAYYTNTFDVEDETFYNSSEGRDTNHERVWFYVKRTW